ncbi:MAG: N-acetylmuramoyl-L-alanine amidase [Lentisphaeria bacterium]|nr:N-acetylmuramoyl-L-alanine amidase [Lentisphaeria bacterium]
MRKILIPALLLLLTFSVSAAPVIRQRQFARLNYCNVYDLLKINRFNVRIQQKKLLASARNRNLVFEHKQRKFQFNGQRVELGFPLVYNGNQSWLTVADWQKTLRPLLYPATAAKHRIYTIYLDMGHGGSDPGAIGRFSKEKNITLALGRRVAAFLRSYGYRVIMTRNSDIYVPLTQVSARQRLSRSDLFVSIHVNSAADKSISGIETFCLTPAGMASSNGGKVDKKSYPGNRLDSNNILLAWNIQRSLLKFTSGRDRGIKRARFAVLKELNVPGVLIEVGFISNRIEEKLLNQRAYQDRIAAGIVNGIVNYSRTVRQK